MRNAVLLVVVLASASTPAVATRFARPPQEKHPVQVMFPFLMPKDTNTEGSLGALANFTAKNYVELANFTSKDLFEKQCYWFIYRAVSDRRVLSVEKHLIENVLSTCTTKSDDRCHKWAIDLWAVV